MIIELETPKKKKLVKKNLIAETKPAEIKPAEPKPTIKKATRKAAPKSYVVIDHPIDGEKVNAGHYAIRIGASSEPVEISIDKAEWKSCRHAGGYFWFDWHISQGEHRIVARVLLSTGKHKNSKIVRCVA